MVKKGDDDINLDDQLGNDDNLSDVLNGKDGGMDGLDMPLDMGGGGDANAIKYQIEVDDYLKSIERILRGEIKIIDEYGNESYGLPRKQLPDGSTEIDYSKRLLNDFGVSQIMNTIHIYINKHLSLSKFDEQRIYQILLRLSIALRMYMTVNAETIGLDTREKRHTISLIHSNVMNCVEACYMRSLKGMTLQTINASSLTAQAPMSMPNINVNTQPQKSIFNPASWFRR